MKKILMILGGFAFSQASFAQNNCDVTCKEIREIALQAEFGSLIKILNSQSRLSEQQKKNNFNQMNAHIGIMLKNVVVSATDPRTGKLNDLESVFYGYLDTSGEAHFAVIDSEWKKLDPHSKAQVVSNILHAIEIAESNLKP